jgi:hypothetical protein
VGNSCIAELISPQISGLRNVHSATTMPVPPDSLTMNLSRVNNKVQIWLNISVITKSDDYGCS